MRGETVDDGVSSLSLTRYIYIYISIEREREMVGDGVSFPSPTIWVFRTYKIQRERERERDNRRKRNLLVIFVIAGEWRQHRGRNECPLIGKCSGFQCQPGEILIWVLSWIPSLASEVVSVPLPRTVTSMWPRPFGYYSRVSNRQPKASRQHTLLFLLQVLSLSSQNDFRPKREVGFRPQHKFAIANAYVYSTIGCGASMPSHFILIDPLEEPQETCNSPCGWQKPFALMLKFQNFKLSDVVPLVYCQNNSLCRIPAIFLVGKVHMQLLMPEIRKFWPIMREEAVYVRKKESIMKTLDWGYLKKVLGESSFDRNMGCTSCCY